MLMKLLATPCDQSYRMLGLRHDVATPKESAKYSLAVSVLPIRSEGLRSKVGCAVQSEARLPASVHSSALQTVLDVCVASRASVTSLHSRLGIKKGETRKGPTPQTGVGKPQWRETPLNYLRVFPPLQCQ